ncbi:COG3650 family protein [Erythrobacter sp. JK5]|uniref:COG3650 family protein n=1 Tax=Erythrobacter sp. JK5 TaxID=2829500 RepID=UPI001BA7E66C|nr:hypothetical protein [Erythrobacter sp. JK5]QUL37898.1 hypothetical protein KDC96_00195 [Erythrobacter sp. JK5]
MDGLLRSGCIGGAIVLVVAGCTRDDGVSQNSEPYAGIDASETLTLLGTEPFWDFEISGETATYTTPENLDGTTIAVSRFAGNNGLGFSGEIDGDALQIAVTPGDCSDGMSDRTYPFTATVSLGDRTLFGCGYTDSQSFGGEEAP